MDRYIDIRAVPTADIDHIHLLEVTFSKLHAALAALRYADIGVSFPEVESKAVGLGPCLRLHGSENRLVALMKSAWHKSLQDYLDFSGIQMVPAGSKYRCVSRVQAKSSPERLRRRQMRRHGLTEEEVKKRIPDNVGEFLALPFIRVKSQSTGQAFRLFVKHGPLQNAPVNGEFSFYGLSDKTTVPWF